MSFNLSRDRMDDPEFREENKDLSSDVADWLDIDVQELSLQAEEDGSRRWTPHFDDDEWVLKGDKMQYLSVAFFMPKGSTSRASRTRWVCLRSRLL